MRVFRIRPEKEGLRSTLFDLEAEIMEAVWGKGWEEFSVADVHEAVSRQRPLAYTTIMTTVSRLFDKGLLTRHRDGRRYLYQPAMSRQEYLSSLTRDVLESLPPMGREVAVAYLVERVAEADDDELARLEEMIRARREAKGD